MSKLGILQTSLLVKSTRELETQSLSSDHWPPGRRKDLKTLASVADAGKFEYDEE